MNSSALNTRSDTSSVGRAAAVSGIDTWNTGRDIRHARHTGNGVVAGESWRSGGVSTAAATLILVKVKAYGCNDDHHGQDDCDDRRGRQTLGRRRLRLLIPLSFSLLSFLLSLQNETNVKLKII